jgi:hypothetical protein
MQMAEDVLPRAADEFADVLTREFEAAGLSIDPVALKAAKARHAAAAISSVQTDVTNDLFRPSGGWGSVSAAGGIDAILKSAMDNAKFGGACGELLAYIVRLDKHHPDIEPSLNRATYIMVQAAKKYGREIPAERDRSTMWTVWGGVAPLWAAWAFCTGDALDRGATHISLGEIISASLWLADFATGFVPKGSNKRKPLLPEEKVIRINPKLEAVEPPIPPLTDEQVAWARAYKVRP